ncbi:MAG: hypothetical protein AB2602_20375, partial [Candidatus Thiodiazotropha sp.]
RHYHATTGAGKRSCLAYRLETTNQQLNERLAVVFRSSGRDAAGAPSAYPKGTSPGRRDVLLGRWRKSTISRVEPA